MAENLFNILIVQADMIQARRIHDLLFDLGHESEMLTDGNAAFSRIRLGSQLHLLVTELSLNNRDGLGLVTELRKRWTKKQAGAVVVTAFPGLMAQAQRTAPSMGIDAVLNTKASAMEILAALKKSLQDKEGKLAPGLAPPEAAVKATAAGVSNLAKAVAVIQLDVDLPLNKALDKLAFEATKAFEMTGVLLRLRPDFFEAAAFDWTGLLGIPAANTTAWDFLEPRSDQGVSKSLLVGDTRASFTLKSQELVRAGYVGAFASVPLADGGKLLGFLCLIDEKVHPFSYEERDLLEGLAKRLSREIAMNVMVNQMRENIAAQWQISTDREAHMALLGNVLEALHLGVLIQDQAGKTVFANSRLAEITGQDVPALTRMDAKAFHQAFKKLVDRPEDYEAVVKSLGSAPFKLDRVLETKLPRRQILHWTAMPVEGAEAPLQLHLWEDITSDVDLQAQRAGLASQDPLTELLNRRGAEEELSREAERSRRNKRPYALLRLFLQGLDEVNRSEGFTSGDMALQAMGVCLRKCLRLPDRAARWKGREFMVILPETPDKQAHLVAGRIRDAVAKLDLGYPLSVCGGVACSEAFESAAQCLASADARMEAARAQGPGVIL